MKSMGLKRIVGFCFMFLSFVLFFSNVRVTGAVIGNNASNSLSFLSVLFLIIGLILASRKDENYAEQVLHSGKYVSKTKDLKKIARKMGYTLREGYKEGTRVYDGKDVITTIPGHKEVGGKGTSKGILEALASGESSFRKHHIASD